MDLNFEQLLANHNQNYKEAEVFSSWMPPDGEYIASIIKLDKGSKDDLLWWKLVGRIEDVQDEKLNGKEFTLAFLTSKLYGKLKGVVKDLTGELIQDLKEAHLVLESSIGKIVRVKVSTETSKKNGKDYTNCYIQEVLVATDEASAEMASDPGESPLTEAPPTDDSEGERQAIPE
jgi:hypothetical protein